MNIDCGQADFSLPFFAPSHANLNNNLILSAISLLSMISPISSAKDKKPIYLPKSSLTINKPTETK